MQERDILGDEIEGISTRQLRAIWALARCAHLNEGELHAKVSALSGKGSIRALTRRQAGRIIERLQREVGSASTAERRGETTRFQVSLIEILGKAMGWETDRVLGLAHKMYGVDRLEGLTVIQASGLIEALKAIRGRRAA